MFVCDAQTRLIARLGSPCVRLFLGLVVSDKTDTFKQNINSKARQIFHTNVRSWISLQDQGKFWGNGIIEFSAGKTKGWGVQNTLHIFLKFDCLWHVRFDREGALNVLVDKVSI